MSHLGIVRFPPKVSLYSTLLPTMNTYVVNKRYHVCKQSICTINPSNWVDEFILVKSFLDSRLSNTYFSCYIFMLYVIWVPIVVQCSPQRDSGGAPLLVYTTLISTHNTHIMPLYDARIWNSLSFSVFSVKVTQNLPLKNWGNPMTLKVLDRKSRNDLTRDWTIQDDTKGGVSDN